LGRALVVAESGQRAGIGRLTDIVADELNVKAVEFAEREQDLVSYKLLPDNRVLGKKFGKQFPAVRAALGALEPYAAVHALRAGQSLTLDVDSQPVVLVPEEVLIQAQPREGFAVATGAQAEGGVVVALDTRLTPELAAEGQAREIVRHIQTLRKDAGFELSDRIETSYSATGDVAQAIAAWADYIKAETLSVALESSEVPAGEKTESFKLDGQPVTIAVKRVPRRTAQNS
jgi:isoleucyl-tRNA synthetase